MPITSEPFDRETSIRAATVRRSRLDRETFETAMAIEGNPVVRWRTWTARTLRVLVVAFLLMDGLTAAEGRAGRRASGP
jgi:hypothetical protein